MVLYVLTDASNNDFLGVFSSKINANDFASLYKQDHDCEILMESCYLDNNKVNNPFQKLQDICKAFLEYRKNNTINFQLEKADDFFQAIALLIKD